MISVGSHVRILLDPTDLTVNRIGVVFEQCGGPDALFSGEWHAKDVDSEEIFCTTFQTFVEEDPFLTFVKDTLRDYSDPS